MQAAAEYKFNNLPLEVSVVHVDSSFNHEHDNLSIYNTKKVFYINDLRKMMKC